MTSSKWVRFWKLEPDPNRKTDTWTVWAQGVGGAFLGEVKWYSPWRQYCFYPAESTIWNPECLSDVGVFCRLETRYRREARKLRAVE